MIPEKWRFVPLSEIITRVRNPVLVDNNTSYREIGIRSHGKGIFYKNPKTGEELGNKSVFWIEPECFIVNIVFAWEQAVAKTTIYEKGMIASHRFPMYKPKSNHLSLEYLLYFFKTSKGKYLLELASPGGAGRNKTLGQAEFLKLEILLPPISEQLRIVEILGVWDESIDLLEKLIGRVRSRKQGLMQQLLTGKKRFKEFEGSEYSIVKFSEVAKIRRGASPRPIQDPKWFAEKGRGWVRIRDVTASDTYLLKT
jgi:type I restriction enzyme, S subunit